MSALQITQGLNAPRLQKREEYALEFLKNIFMWKGPELALTHREMLIIRDLGNGFQAWRITRI